MYFVYQGGLLCIKWCVYLRRWGGLESGDVTLLFYMGQSGIRVLMRRCDKKKLKELSYEIFQGRKFQVRIVNKEGMRLRNVLYF